MYYYNENPSLAPNGPRSYQENGGGRNNRNGNASFVPKGTRQHQGNGGGRNNRANNNYHANGNGNGNGNNQWSPRNGNGNGNRNHNNQWDNHQNDIGNVSPTDHGMGNANHNGNPNYRGQNFNPNYKGKNYNPNFSRPVPANTSQARNGNWRRQSNKNHNNHQNQNKYSQPVSANSDVQMAEAPTDEPNDIEMPDAPPLPDPRIEAFTMGALAVKEIAETMLKLASELDPSYVPS
ncbi:hypothetical protein Pdw03_6326 [Penicillium digitatum]|uniref:Uncharacterized protein n=3 Tax=Penicillium digitatum TaxID=36651 RepID=K9GVL6_PEND2|nr:hypothetical protein PDIP_37750 [Penicillium digitatum Pd1]EKV16163.1 hypothetical protein PDIP_37750 [Penicillium digitatum Pd1]EKV18658.1 hypothetical protein PDIG_09720 [Penicillium digitatum PHI26]QQK42425.1 hypothetical protein Pdw03_6326 [Penicillium digitatum]